MNENKEELKRLSEMTQEAIVAEIHENVDKASENVLSEAKTILASKTNEELEEMREIAALGFEKAKDVQEAKAKLAEIELQKARMEIIMEYKRKYPLHKYILVETMQAICAKYNLFIGPDKAFVGKIPAKNRKEIIAFNKVFKTEDHIFYEGRVDREGIIRFQEVEEGYYNNATNNGKNLVQNGNRLHYISNKDYYSIVAPISDFDTSNLSKEGNTLLEKVKIVNEDPIVLKTVKHGFLVVSKWGPEAELPEFQNPAVEN